MFGRSTNSFFKNLGWAKKGILSFSYTPLVRTQLLCTVLFLLSGLWALDTSHPACSFPAWPHGAPPDHPLHIFFGSVNLLGNCHCG